MRLIQVVDVGAFPAEDDCPYQTLWADGLCLVDAFEPQVDRIDAQYHSHLIPWVIGDGQPATLRICYAPGMTSLLEPDPQALALFPGFKDWGRVLERRAVQTVRLDDIAPAHIDFIKIDAQGSELAIIRGGATKLKSAVVVQVEVQFIALYENQPTFWEIDRALRSLGFVPHKFVKMDHRLLHPCNYGPASQLLSADMVYVRDFTRMGDMTDGQLKHMALIARCCYGSLDLHECCIRELESRGRLSDNSALAIPA